MWDWENKEQGAMPGPMTVAQGVFMMIDTVSEAAMGSPMSRILSLHVFQARNWLPHLEGDSPYPIIHRASRALVHTSAGQLPW